MNAQWIHFAQEVGIETCLAFDPRLLMPEQRIRDYCSENKCGNYGTRHMCPPRIGSLEETKSRLGTYQEGILLQYSKPLDVKNDRVRLRQSKLDFHEKLLKIEEFLRSDGIEHPWGMIGGSCALCDVCRVDEPCPYPEKARTSLEALGIDVMVLLEGANLDNKFHPDKITWTGCVLY
jgi:predicted metal-binding protein